MHPFFSAAYNKAMGFFENPPVVEMIIPKNAFELSKEEDRQVVISAIHEFNQKFRAVKAIDDQMYRQLVYAVAFYGAHQLLSSFLLNLGCAFGSGYYCTRFGTYESAHDTAFQEYREAYQKLLTIYHWVMEDKNDMQQKLHHLVVQNLICAIGPMLSVNTLKAWSEDNLKPIAGTVYGETPLASSFKEKINEFTSESHERTWVYLLYGEKANGDLRGAIQILAASPLKNAGKFARQVPATMMSWTS